MDLSPQVIANSTFPVVRRGYEPDEVRAFLAEVARAYDAAARHAASMESRARTAVAKVHELQNAAPAEPGISKDDAETISRTLLLAQRAADSTLAEARAEAEAVLAGAQVDARRVLADAEAELQRELAEARAEVRRQVEAERVAAQSEVQALMARRDFLVSDVEALERHVADQRRRLREIADLLVQVADQAPGGLGEVRRPVLSAAGDAGAPVGGADTGATRPAGEVFGEPSTDDLWSEDDGVSGAFDDGSFSDGSFSSPSFSGEPFADGPFVDEPFVDVMVPPVPAVGFEPPVDPSSFDAPALPLADVESAALSFDAELDPTPHENSALLDFDRLPRRPGRPGEPS